MEANRSSGLVALARLFWMLIGPAILFMLAGTIAGNDTGWFAPASIAFLVILPVMIAARWMDGDNSYGDPTTPAEVTTYTIGAIIVGLALWVVANFAGNHWPPA
jgi:hypothetical protein